VADNAENPSPEEPLFRAALVERIRREIAAGTYETPEKWEIALDRLLERLEGEAN
jgi:negative regulator of flagellin synthesis FlgM